MLEAFRLRFLEMHYQAEAHPKHMALRLNAEMEVTTIIVENPNNHPSILHLIVSASHAKYFPSGITEGVVGIGQAFKDQVATAIDNYINVIFLTIIESLSDRHHPGLDFFKNVNGKDVLLHPSPGILHVQGKWTEQPPDENFFLELLKQLIIELPMVNKLNWLKIYISKRADGTVIGECLFNNEHWNAGLTEISNYVMNWHHVEEFQALKQFIMFRRCDAYDSFDN